ncbi:hypothetical protein [Kitasatospora sp. NPDC088779]|uniref:hypothetical protein n=1 Tax=Kitasatospora sp. NPDC088779 TaxID=3154964 RepID=UPI003445F349
MTQVPRHVLIPRAYQRLGSKRPVRRWRLLDAIGDLAALLELIYSTDQVVVRIGGVRPEEQSVGAECTGAPTTMSSQPDCSPSPCRTCGWNPGTGSWRSVPAPDTCARSRLG